MLLHKGTKTINTDRLILRKFEINDAENMFKNWATDLKVVKYLPWKIHENIEFTRSLLTGWIEKYQNDNEYQWIIHLKEIDEPIGSIGVVRSDESKYSCEIGYCISSNYWSKGIMTEALKAVIDYLFSEIGFNRIIALHDTNNIASGKVMSKSNMLYEGTFRQAGLRDDQYFYDLAQYAILKSDWENNKL